jgi:hypothetical protein
MCLFFRHNGAEGFYEGKENLIPQVLNSFLWIWERKTLEDSPFEKKKYSYQGK